MKETWLKYGGIAAVVIGSGALYASGTNESEVGGLVAGIFVIGGIVAQIIKDKMQE